MDPTDVKTLMLLEAIEQEGCQSQRQLSKKIHVSLGLVNKFIKKLTIGGIFTTVNLPGKRVRYTLTPKGIDEKANLTRKYLSHSIGHYNEIKRMVSELLLSLQKDGKREIIFYGTGELIEITCVILCDHSIHNVIIIDNEKAGRTICGLQIYEDAKIDSLKFDAVIITDFESSSIFRDDLINKGIPPDKIFTLPYRELVNFPKN